MYEMTDEAGVLRIPVWPYDNDVDPVKRYFHAEMAWSREDAEALVREFQTLVDALSEMALLWKNEELGFSEEENRGILSDEQLKVWNTYIKELNPEDMDYMHFYDITEKMDEFGAVSPEDLKYYYAYVDRIHEEARRRLGGKYAQYDRIIRAQRLHKLMAQEAPQVLIDNEARLLAEAMVLETYAKKVRIKPGLYRCPVCGEWTLSSRGEYEICNECGWEDDKAQYPDENEPTYGPNGTHSVRSYRESYQRLRRENPDMPWQDLTRLIMAEQPPMK